jgi:hypothetical protein
MVLLHILAELCDMFSVTPIVTDGYVEDTLHGLHAHQTSILWIFSSGNTLKPLCMQLMFTTKTHFTIALWMPVTLYATILAS